MNESILRSPDARKYKKRNRKRVATEPQSAIDLSQSERAIKVKVIIRNTWIKHTPQYRKVTTGRPPSTQTGENNLPRPRILVTTLRIAVSVLPPVSVLSPLLRIFFFYTSSAQTPLHIFIKYHHPLTDHHLRSLSDSLLQKRRKQYNWLKAVVEVLFFARPTSLSPGGYARSFRCANVKLLSA